MCVLSKGFSFFLTRQLISQFHDARFQRPPRIILPEDVGGGGFSY